MRKWFFRVVFFILAVCFFGTVKINAEDRVFNVTSSIDYNKSQIKITGVTPAKYRQLINIIIYKPDEHMLSLNSVDFDDPQSEWPLTNVAYIKRITNVNADITGNFSTEFKIAELEEGYYILSASGGGYMSADSKDSEMIFISSQERIDSTLLPALSSETGAPLLICFEELKNVYKFDLGSGYEEDEYKFQDYFINVREDEFSGVFTSLTDVQKAFNAVNLIMTTVRGGSEEELQEIYEAQCDSLSLYDKTDEDYTENKEAVYHILNVNAVEERGYIENLTDIRRIFFQAQGIATINIKNSVELTDTIVKYGDSLGIDVEKYQYYCRKYGETMVNRAFVGMNFVNIYQVVIAYDAMIGELDDSNNTSSGSGGGGGGGGGTIVPVTPTATEMTLDSYVVSKEQLSYTICVEDYKYSTVCVTIYDPDMKLLSVDLYKLLNKGTHYIHGQVIRKSDMKYFEVFCLDSDNLEPACISIEKRI